MITYFMDFRQMENYRSQRVEATHPAYTQIHPASKIFPAERRPVPASVPDYDARNTSCTELGYFSKKMWALYF